MSEKLRSETTFGFDSRAYPFGEDTSLKKDVSKMKASMTITMNRAQRNVDGTIRINGVLSFEKTSEDCECVAVFPEYPLGWTPIPTRKDVELILCTHCIKTRDSESSEESKGFDVNMETGQEANHLSAAVIKPPEKYNLRQYDNERIVQHVKTHNALSAKSKYFVRTVEVIPRVNGAPPAPNRDFLSIGIPRKADINDVLAAIRRVATYLNKRMCQTGNPDLSQDQQLTPADVLRDFEAVDDALREINTSFTEIERSSIRKLFDMARERNRRKLREGNASPTLPDNLETESEEEEAETAVSDEAKGSGRSQGPWQRGPVQNDWNSPQRSLRPKKE